MTNNFYWVSDIMTYNLLSAWHFCTVKCSWPLFWDRVNLLENNLIVWASSFYMLWVLSRTALSVGLILPHYWAKTLLSILSHSLGHYSQPYMSSGDCYRESVCVGLSLTICSLLTYMSWLVLRWRLKTGRELCRYPMFSLCVSPLCYSSLWTLATLA